MEVDIHHREPDPPLDHVPTAADGLRQRGKVVRAILDGVQLRTVARQPGVIGCEEAGVLGHDEAAHAGLDVDERAHEVRIGETQRLQRRPRVGRRIDPMHGACTGGGQRREKDEAKEHETERTAMTHGEVAMTLQTAAR